VAIVLAVMAVVGKYGLDRRYGVAGAYQLAPSDLLRNRHAYARPKVSHRRRMASYETVMPLCARRSSTSRKPRVNR
jgi:hypothetical protein